jgi:hypothetical protein
MSLAHWNTTFIIIPVVIFYYIKVIRQFRWFAENLFTRKNPMNNPNIYNNLLGDNRLSLGLQHVITRSAGVIPLKNSS